MKSRYALAIVSIYISVILTACDLFVERSATEELILPVVATTSPEAVPIGVIVAPPSASEQPKPTATTRNFVPATGAVSTLSDPTSTASPVPSSTSFPPTSGSLATPIPAATQAGNLESTLIMFFKADVEETDPGESITLEWGTNQAIFVTLWHLAPTGQFSQFWSVSENDTFEYEVGLQERNRTTFALSAIDTNGNSEMATVAITLRCPDQWFFDNPPDICPVTAPIISEGDEQQFERGTMIWIAAESRIYVLFDDGQQYAWQVYNDNWNSGEAESDSEVKPPSGLYLPVRGFGLVWRQQQFVKDRLGWATGEETAFETTIQRTSYAKYNETYVRAMDGALWRLMAERSGWEKIPSRPNS